MGTCKLCHNQSPGIAETLSVCLECIRKRPKEAVDLTRSAHAKTRAGFGLPERPPKAPEGIPCKICVNECIIPEKGTGYCGLRKNEGGKLTGVSASRGKLSWYFDPLPTNCVGDWVCAGGTGAGYPKYACKPGPETGCKNLAVFFHACSFNCLFCQNWQFKEETLRPQTTPVDEMVSDIDEQTTCICYFGGDPTPQIPFSIKASRRAIKENKGRILRICWETNGSMHPGYLDKMLEISLSSGGCIKFDLKAWNEPLHIALTGVTNKRTLANFARAGRLFTKREVPPLLLASTLLVPGYIDEKEIRSIARFIRSIHPEIPYTLLAFHPHYHMTDLPLTSGDSAYEYRQIAREEGLAHVRVGNVHLLR